MHKLPTPPPWRELYILGGMIPFGEKNGIRLCDGNSVVSRDLSLKEVSEYNGIVRIIVRSVCKQFDRANGFQYSNLMQFDSLTFQQKILINGFNGLGTVVLSLISENPRSRFRMELI